MHFDWKPYRLPSQSSSRHRRLHVPILVLVSRQVFFCYRNRERLEGKSRPKKSTFFKNLMFENHASRLAVCPSVPGTASTKFSISCVGVPTGRFLLLLESLTVGRNKLATEDHNLLKPDCSKPHVAISCVLLPVFWVSDFPNVCIPGFLSFWVSKFLGF